MVTTHPIRQDCVADQVRLHEGQLARSMNGGPPSVCKMRQAFGSGLQSNEETRCGGWVEVCDIEADVLKIAQRLIRPDD